MSNAAKRIGPIILPALIIVALALWLMPIPVRAANPAILNVEASGITETTAIISWTTDINATGNVDYGMASGVYTDTRPSPVDATADNTSHAIFLSGLNPNTTYYYVVKSSDSDGDTTSSQFSFKTKAFTISGVNTSSITTSSAVITWTTSVAASGNVEYGESTSYGSAAPAPEDTSADTSNQIVVLSGLDANTTYHYRVKSKDASASEEMSEDKTFTTLKDTTAPAISSVASSDITQTTATITWDTNEPADSLVEYGLSVAYGASTPLDPNLVTGHSLALSGLTPGTTYHYQVMSSDASGNPAVSDDFTFATLADETDPIISGVASPTVTTTSATITWTTDELATGNLAYGLTASYGSSAPVPADTGADKTSHSIVISGLTPGTTYHYQVMSSDASGNPAVSADLTFTTAADSTPPVISGIASTSITGTTATITWTTSESATSNLVYGLTTSYGSSSPVTADTTADRTSHSIVISGLAPNTTYYYQVKSKDVTGNQSASEVLDVYKFTTDADTTAPLISSVSAPSKTATSATITWTTNELATSNLVYGTTLSYGSSSPIPADTTADKTSHSIVISGLAPNTTYYYQVESKDATGNTTVSAVSADFTFTTAADTAAPGISGVTHSGITTDSAIITWTTSELADSLVEYGLNTGYGSTTPVDATLVNSHILTLSGLAPNTTYHYRVKSRDASNNETVSTDFTFTTLADTTAPEISDVASSGITTSSAIITWTTDELADSLVEYGLTTAYGTSTPADTTLLNSHSLSLSGLSPNTTYHYQVKSRDASNNETVSTDFTFTTLADTVAPAMSGVTSSGITTGSAIITWTTDELADSLVEYGLTSSYGSAAPADNTPKTSHSISLSGLAPNTTYHYRVKSKDASNNEAVSADNTFTTLADTTAPEISGVASSDITINSAVISWTTSEPATGNLVYGLTTSYGSSFPAAADTTADNTSHSLELSGLSPNTTYHYQVKSRDAAGNEAVSADFTFTTLIDTTDTTAPVISGVTSSDITTTSAAIAWTTSEPATSNLVYGPTTSYGSSFPAAADTTADMTSHSLELSVLTSGTTYHYQVKSRDASGNEATSADFTFTTPLVQQNITPASASTVETEDGKISIQVPAGSVAGNAVLTISKVSPADIPAAPSGFKAGATSFKVELSTALISGKTVTITVEYSDADLAAAGGDAALLRLSRYDASAGEWVVLPTTVDTAAKTLSAETGKFSTWAVMVSQPEAEAETSSSMGVILIVVVIVVIAVIAGAVLLLKKKSAKK